MAQHLYIGAGAGVGLRPAGGRGKPFPRQGVWAIYEGKVGIVAAMNDDGLSCEFHRVDDAGDTTVVVLAPLVHLRQAYYEQIPAARRPDMVTAHRLGYLSVPNPSRLARLVTTLTKG